MRSALALGIACLLSAPVVAHAADMPGSSIFGSGPAAPAPNKAAGAYDWGGLYAGVHVSQSEMRVNPGQAIAAVGANTFKGSEFQTQAANYSRLVSGGTFSGRETGYGVYVGHNWTEEDLVVGVEGEFMQAGLKGSAGGAIGFYENAGQYRRYVDVDARAQTEVSQIYLLKGRAGVAFDRILPYAFVGFGIARTSINNRVDGLGRTYVINPDQSNGTLVSFAASSAVDKRRSYIPGIALGLGVDWALVDNVVLRAEYQYLALQKSHGQENVVNSGKIGLAAKF
jgi:outer membrane immunogenic protein